MDDVSLFEHGRHRADPLMLAALHRIEQKVDQIMADQDILNQIAQQIETDVTGENAALATIQADIAALEAAAGQGQPLDFTAVNQSVADLGTALGSIQQVATSATPPAPTPTPGG
jgi:hypothetical protein